MLVPGVPTAAHSINFVDEDNCGSFGASGSKQIPHSLCSHSNVHLIEFAAAHEEEGYTGFPGNSPSKHRFPGAGRTGEKNAFGKFATKACEFGRVLQKHHNFLQVLLGLIHALYIIEFNGWPRWC